MARPKTGERRRARQPLKIDRLPIEVRDKIQALRSKGKTWQEIEELSALPVDKGGFVAWDALPTPVLELFPDLRLPHTNLHRWYDLRVEQVQAEVLNRAQQARKIAEAFAAADLENSNDAVMNAARDIIFGLMERADDGSRMYASKALLALAEVVQEARKNDIRERQVAVDERKLKALEAREELTRRKLEAETEKAAKKLSKGQLTPEDLGRLAERTFGLKPVATHG
ncbi:DUF3486 family protein [Alloacidobacterium dinghuense]|uniref:DUF3486 family protein n=1 Tax=Alloacidobacterium dinghuense TaxID=2763107 RepID=A0A7G8BPQ2_9BACT|nr:DUF3486 family protein [Alloacidobacterium dinghuense]QNI34522.1 DUF3486 family protein [Alloacidobacterium dinghuense]